ncbi:MAG: hypothetical protein LAO55_06720 [Acidobacteriia bacterium]|nr:hypothetical protein [Terriglobia bacterium]
MASFTEQLTAALEGYLAQSGNSSNLEIDIQASQSQNSGVRQFIVTVKNPDSAAGQAGTAASLTPPAAGTSKPQALASVTASTPASTPSTKATPSNNPQMDAADAYWAAQPEAVQQLRDIKDFGERSLMAQQLADQGYTIDLPIMAWGWDPLTTMQTRQTYGYTWVPSMNQAPASTPGLTVADQKPYDPAKPPAGSIAVNTDFAKGLGITT